MKPQTTTGDLNLESIPAEMKAEPRWLLHNERKAPMQPNGSHGKSNDPATWSTFEDVDAAYKTGRFAGIGFATGGGFVCVDLDKVNKAGEIHPAAKEILDAVDGWVEVSLSGTGLHVWVRGDDAAKLKAKIDDLVWVGGTSPPVVEIFGGGQFVAMTGKTLDGSTEELPERSAEINALRELYGGAAGESKPLGDIPPTWPDREPLSPAEMQRMLEWAEQQDEAVVGADGSAVAMKISKALRFKGLNYDDSFEIFCHWNDHRATPPFSYDDDAPPADSLLRKFEQGCSAALRDIADLQSETFEAIQEFEKPIEKREKFPLTDYGNAERFAAQHGDRVRYVKAWGWFVWDGTRWQKDETGEAMRLVKETVRSLLREAADADSHSQRDDLVKFNKASEASGKLKALLDTCATEQPIAASTESFDEDGALINTASGTVDLKTGELRPNDPGDHLTKSTETEYAAGTGWQPPPLWVDVLERIFDGDRDLVAYVQRLFGMALLGGQFEAVFPILYGAGANGKSVLVGAIMHAMGEYAGTAAPKLFTKTKHNQHPTELADLHGKRLVVLNETGQGDSLDEPLVKAVTGGDRIKARLMRQDFFEFEPTHTAMMLTNNRPTVFGKDNGIWRRLKLIPFDVTIPVEEQDPQLLDKLKRLAPDILRWLVEGCLDYQQRGYKLDEPASVIDATGEYRSDCDPFWEFIRECCDIGADYRAVPSDLLSAYNAFSDDTLSAVRFATLMKQHGFDKKREATARTYMGLRLKPGAEFD